MLIFRALQFSRLAMLSALAVGSAISSSSQRRPRASDATNRARVSERIGRACSLWIPSGQKNFATLFCRCLPPSSGAVTVAAAYRDGVTSLTMVGDPNLTLSEKRLCRQSHEMQRFDCTRPWKNLPDRFVKGSVSEGQTHRAKLRLEQRMSAFAGGRKKTARSAGIGGAQ